MNAPESPLSPETLDELLSADIDGELAPAAADLGFTLDEALAAIAAAPEASQRRAELMRARDLLAARTPLDEQLELRLVAAALDRSMDELRAARDRPRRIRRRLAAVGSVAAAAAVIVGVVALAATNTGHGSSSKASRSTPLGDFGGPATHSALIHTQSVAFGDVSNPRTLGAEVEARLAIAVTPLTPANLPPSVGTTGSQDLVGQDGDIGLIGPQGPSGSAGPTGPSGAQGVTGPIGATGSLGAVGKVGPSPTGSTGTIGGIGGIGGIGPIGAIGAAAAVGPLGVTGPEGEQLSLSGLVGPQGVQGDEGIVSTAGPTQFSANRQAGKPVDALHAANAHEQVCTAAIRHRANLPAGPVLSGTGTDAGIPAVVAVFAHGHDYVVYVLAASDCTLLSQQTLP